MNPDYSIELDEKSSKKVEWEKILFNQIELTARLMTLNEPSFPRGVEALKTLLVFFYENDPKFAPDVEKIDEEAEKTLESMKSPSGRVSQTNMEDVAWTRAKLRFENCLKLMGRAGFYPESQVEWEDKPIKVVSGV